MDPGGALPEAYPSDEAGTDMTCFAVLAMEGKFLPAREACLGYLETLKNRNHKCSGRDCVCFRAVFSLMQLFQETGDYQKCIDWVSSWYSYHKIPVPSVVKTLCLSIYQSHDNLEQPVLEFLTSASTEEHNLSVNEIKDRAHLQQQLDRVIGGEDADKKEASDPVGKGKSQPSSHSSGSDTSSSVRNLINRIVRLLRRQITRFLLFLKTVHGPEDQRATVIYLLFGGLASIFFLYRALRRILAKKPAL